MAEDWRELVRNSYSGYNALGGGLVVVIQYDKNSITTTSVKLRTKAWFPSGNKSSDTYFIYSDGGGISRICYLSGHQTGGSGSRGSNPYYSNTFTLSKTNTATKFTMPAVRICNDGSHRTVSAYTDSNGRGASSYWTSARGDWSSLLNSGGTDLSTTVYVTGIGTGTTTITDNYNNTFTITAAKGADGNYNAAGGPIDLKYGYASTSRNTTYTSGTAINLSLSGTGNTRTVYAESTTTATIGDSKKSTNSLAIRQYRAPGAPSSKPALTSGSYKNGRLTIKLPWTYEWGVAPPGTGSGTTNGTGTNQTTSAVKGYRVRLMRKSVGSSSFNTIAIKTNATTTITTHNTSEGNYMDITNPATRSITFDPAATGIVPGDKVKFQVKPFTRYGASNNGSQLFGTYSDSDESLVQNAGVMRVRPTSSSGWKEGVVWVKVNKNGTAQWVEADVVKTKTSSGWKESV